MVSVHRYCTEKLDAAACILAGGQGRRLRGLDKLQLVLGGERLVDRLVRNLTGRFADILVATARPEVFVDCTVRCVPDWPGFAGPLAGLVSAFYHTDKPWLYLLAVDMPGFSASWVDFLEASTLEVIAGGGWPLAVMAGSGEYLEPFQAFYHRDILDTLPKQPGEKLSIQRMLMGQSVLRISEVQQRPFHPERLFFNINTPEDLAHAERLLASNS